MYTWGACRARVCIVVCARARDTTSDALQRLPATVLPMPHPITGNEAIPSKNTVTFLPSAYPVSCFHAAVLGIHDKRIIICFIVFSNIVWRTSVYKTVHYTRKLR